MRTKGAVNRDIDWEARGIECRERQRLRREANETEHYEWLLDRLPMIQQRVFTKICWTFGRQPFRMDELKCSNGEWLIVHELIESGFIVKSNNQLRIL